MTTRRNILQGLTGAVLCTALPLPALAHREKYSLTQISWNAGDSTLNVIHSFHMHDVEMALAGAGMIERPDLTSLKSKARLALYTADTFKLMANDGSDIPLELLGAENEGRSVYVYQQTKLSNKPSGLIVDCAMLRELIDGQINNVDINLSGEIQSLLFKGSDGPKRV